MHCAPLGIKIARPECCYGNVDLNNTLHPSINVFMNLGFEQCYNEIQAIILYGHCFLNLSKLFMLDKLLYFVIFCLYFVFFCLYFVIFAICISDNGRFWVSQSSWQRNFWEGYLMSREGLKRTVCYKDTQKVRHRCKG